MTRTLSTNNTTEIALTVIREHFLVTIGFTGTNYLSSRGDITFDGQNYVGVNMQLELKLDGSGGLLTFLDEDFTILPQLIADGAPGAVCNVYALYGDPAFAGTDDDELFSGELGQWVMTDDVLAVELVESRAKWLPDITISVANGFNHLPRPGTRIKTLNGIIELGKS